MRKFSILMAFALLFAGVSTTMATKPHPGHKVAICHRTASSTNPYVLIEVDEAAVNTHLGNGHGHPAKTNADGSPRNDFLYIKGEAECNPGVEATETPEVTPTATPEVTQSPEVTPSPEASQTPEVTPVPDATPEPTLPSTDTEATASVSQTNIGLVAIISGLLMLGAGLMYKPIRRT